MTEKMCGLLATHKAQDDFGMIFLCSTCAMKYPKAQRIETKRVCEERKR